MVVFVLGFGAGFRFVFVFGFGVGASRGGGEVGEGFDEEVGVWGGVGVSTNIFSFLCVAEGRRGVDV